VLGDLVSGVFQTEPPIQRPTESGPCALIPLGHSPADHRFRLRLDASMLGMLLASLAAWTWWPMAIASLLFFLAGTEVRVHAEERLLADRFQAEFAQYRKSTWAYIPFIR
jgi:hypothetical protein